MRYVFIFFLLFSFVTKAEEYTEIEENSKILLAQASIAEVNISYTLFSALAEYAELTQAENSQHLDVNEKIIPVLETILQEYEQELQKYMLLLNENSNQELQSKVNKLVQYAKDFQKELIYRKKVVELNQLIKKQQSIKQGK